MSNAPITMITWVTLHRAHARVRGYLTRRMETECGVSVLEHGSLYELSNAPERRLPMAELADRLSDRLETRVKVDLGRSKGRITVEFASMDDLRRIVDVMDPRNRDDRPI